MVDKEIIKAFNIVVECEGKDAVFANVNIKKEASCEYKHIALTFGDILDLINRQQAELEGARIGVKSYKGKYESAVKTAKELQTLVDEQQAEIENFKMVLDAVEDHINPLPFETDYAKAIRQAKSEAIKEFAERLKAMSEYGVINVSPWQVDNLVKEMVGEE